MTEHTPCKPAYRKVAVVSFLFNWPSRGGGIVHTVELVQWLARAGYNVRHFHVRFEPYGIGRVDESLPIHSLAIPLKEEDWNIGAIQAKVRRAVDAFGPDCVILTDCWNFKPHLAEAVSDYPYFLRQQAMECLCPLNNLRLLSEDGIAKQCLYHQLADRGACLDCLKQRSAQSGALHRVERELSGVETPEYNNTLRRAFSRAEAVLVLNPEIAETIRPFAGQVRVVTWGMNPERFPWPWPFEVDRTAPPRATIFMAGVIDEWIKGFHILHEACRMLWAKRQDFELAVTGEPAGQIAPFTRLVGWLSQEKLPEQLRRADILAMPTIAQEGLGRTTVEAMAVGRPVVATRIGGLPFTVTDGETGLLFKPGNATDLAAKLERLLDDAVLRARMGAEGRRQFEERFQWPDVIRRQYGSLLGDARRERQREDPRGSPVPSGT